MIQHTPHYLLFAEASANRASLFTWRFVLQDIDSERRLSASDQEFSVSRERLELLAVVRGLEAIDGPARVTLVTKSRYVARGLRKGLSQWRETDWRWERFGSLVPVRDADLWQRVDTALGFHDVNCQTWHFEEQIEPSEEEPTDTIRTAPQDQRRRTIRFRSRRPQRHALLGASA